MKIVHIYNIPHAHRSIVQTRVFEPLKTRSYPSPLEFFNDLVVSDYHHIMLWIYTGLRSEWVLTSKRMLSTSVRESSYRESPSDRTFSWKTEQLTDEVWNVDNKLNQWLDEMSLSVEVTESTMYPENLRGWNVTYSNGVFRMARQCDNGSEERPESPKSGGLNRNIIECSNNVRRSWREANTRLCSMAPYTGHWSATPQIWLGICNVAVYNLYGNVYDTRRPYTIW